MLAEDRLTTSTPVSEAPRKRTWPFVVGAVPLLALNIFLNPPEGGVSGRGTGFVVGYLLAGTAVQLLIVAAVYGVARFIRRHKTPPAVPVVAFATLLSLVALDFLSAIGGRGRRTSATTLDQDERQGLQIEIDSIRHPRLGFSIPNPGPTFAPLSPELQARMDSSLADHADMAAWALSSAEAGASVIIQLIKLPFLNEQRFREFVHGLRSSGARSNDAVVVGESAAWNPPSGDYHLTLHYSAGVFLQTRCLSRSRPDGYFIVCVQTTSADSTA